MHLSLSVRESSWRSFLAGWPALVCVVEGSVCLGWCSDRVGVSLAGVVWETDHCCSVSCRNRRLCRDHRWGDTYTMPSSKYPHSCCLLSVCNCCLPGSRCFCPNSVFLSQILTFFFPVWLVWLVDVAANEI